MLGSKEIRQLLKILKKIDHPHEGLPPAVFNGFVRVVPFVACELVVVNSKKQILLTWRRDQWWTGWHFPGGLLRYNETFEERIQQTALTELGVDVVRSKFLFPVNYTSGPRGHAVSLVFLCETETKPVHGKFFGKMPRAIINEHKDVWEKVRKKLKR
jgi:ADP-ribose pyrophosphatase YjhB (NUDIX family)